MARKATAAKPVETPAAHSAWRNRIIGYGLEEATQLLANPKNWRIHPQEQQQALGGVLAQVGWVQNVVVNQRTGFVVDGHLRVAMSISAQEKVPVCYVDLSDEEEALVLATIDPITGMAGRDDELLTRLLSDIRSSEIGQNLEAGLQDLLGSLEDQRHGPVEGEDEIPPLPVAAVTQPGDLWLLGGHVVCPHCGTVNDA